MADLEHSLSLADALSEPPPDIEEEVKRDFIATLEAEKFDDVVGETVDKTDYVPLLDDEDGKGGSQEPRSKPHADAGHGEHTPTSGPMVVENGDHGIGNNRTVFPGEAADGSLAYEEFFARSAGSMMGDRDLCFEPQPVFRPVDMAEPFGVHRGADLPGLAFPTGLQHVPMFAGCADVSAGIPAHASMMVPDPAFLGPPYSPAEVLDPSAFLGLDSAAEYLQETAVPEEHWLGAQHAAAGPGAALFAEPPGPSMVTEAEEPHVPASPAALPLASDAAAPAACPAPAAATDVPWAAAPDAGCVPASDAVSMPAEKAGSLPTGHTEPPAAAAAGFVPAAEALPAHAGDGAFAPAVEAAEFVPAAEAFLAHAGDGTFAATLDSAFAPAMEAAGFVPAAEALPAHAGDSAFAPAADNAFAPAADNAFAPATEAAGFLPTAEALPAHAVDNTFAAEAASPDAAFAAGADAAFGLAADPRSPPAVALEFAAAAADAGFASPADAKSQHTVELEFSPAEGAGLVPAADAVSHHAMGLEFAPAADTASPHAVGLEFAPAADAMSHHAADLELGPAAGAAAPHALDSELSPAAEAAAPHALDLELAPAAEADRPHAADSGVAPAAAAETPPAVDAGLTPVPAAGAEAAALEELPTSEGAVGRARPPAGEAPAEATANMEQEREVPEARAELPLEKAKDAGSPASHRAERPPESSEQLPGAAAPVEAKEAPALENEELLPEKPVPAADLPATEKPKEEAEHNHIQQAEPQQEKPLQESPGVPGAQGRPAPRPGERPWGRAQPGPVAGAPQQRPVGCPQRRSPGPAVEPPAAAAPGGVPGAAPRTRVSHNEAAEQPARALPELARSCGDVPRESWDLEGPSGAVRKKKKKPKQKRNQQPRPTELWEENVSQAPKAWPFAFGLQKPDTQPVPPAGARGEQSVALGNGALDAAKDAKITAGIVILGDENAAPPPARLVTAPLDAKGGGFAKAEETSGAGWVSQCNGNVKQVPPEPMDTVEKTKVGGPATAKVPAQPAEISHLDRSRERAGKEPGCSHPAEAPGAIGTLRSEGEAPLQPPPAAAPLSDRGREVQGASPRREPGSGTIPAGPPSAAGSLEKEAKERGGEKSQEAENESFKEPDLPGQGAPLDRLSPEPKLADGTGTGSPGEGAEANVSGSAEQTLLLAAEGDGSRAPSAPAAEHQGPKEPAFGQGADRPRKRRSEGKGKKPRSFPEQVPFPEERAGEWRVEEPMAGAALPGQGKENGFAAGAQRGCPARAEKAKKRGSDGRSRKGDRGSSQAPVLVQGAGGAGRSADTAGRAEGASGAGERGCPSAAEAAEGPAGAEALGKTPQAGAEDRGREAAFTPPGESGVTGKPRKRSSDGKRKSEKAPSGQPAVPESGAAVSAAPSGVEAAAGSPAGGARPGSGVEASQEALAGAAGDVVGSPGQRGAPGGGASAEPGREAETAKAGVPGTAEPRPAEQDGEVAAGPLGPVPESRPRKKGRDAKGRRAEREHPAAAAPATLPAGESRIPDGTAAAAGGALADARAPGSGQESGKGQPGSAVADGEQRGGQASEAASEQTLLLEPGVAGAPPAPGRADGSEAGGTTVGLPAAEQPPPGPTAPDLGRSKERGSDGRGDEAKGASEQPVVVEAGASRAEAQPETPRGTGLVHESSSVSSLGARPLLRAAGGGPGGAGQGSPGLPREAEQAAGAEGLPARAAAPGSGSKEPGPGTPEERPVGRAAERPGRPEPGEAVQGKEQDRAAASRDESEMGEQPPMGPPLEEHTEASGCEVPLPAAAELGDGDTRGPEERPGPGRPSEPPQKATGTAGRTAPGGAGATVTAGGTASAVEDDAAHGSCCVPAPAGSGTATEATGIPAGEPELPGGGEGRDGLAKDASGSGGSAGSAEAAALAVLAAPAAHARPEEPGDGSARHGEASPEEVPALASAGDAPEDAVKEEEQDLGAPAAKGVKPEERTRGQEQLRGYMRPTKSRGAVAAGPARDKAKPPGAAAPARPRPLQGDVPVAPPDR